MRQNRNSEQIFGRKHEMFFYDVKSMNNLTGKYQKRLLYLLLGPLFLIMPFPLLHQVSPFCCLLICYFYLFSPQSRHHLLHTIVVALFRFSSCTPQTTIAYLWMMLVSNSLVQAWHKQIHQAKFIQSSCVITFTNIFQKYTPGEARWTNDTMNMSKEEWQQVVFFQKIKVTNNLDKDCGEAPKLCFEAMPCTSK